MERSFVTPGPEGLKALSHPGRLRMLGLLRSDGPATATTLATRLGLNSGATSYHLRQLEKHGFVVEDEERGNGRDRWWRAAHTTTRTDFPGQATPEEHDTYDAYLQAVAMLYQERMLRSLEERQLLPEPWREIGDMSDWSLHLTPRRAEALVDAVHTMIDEYAEDDPDDPDAAPFVLNFNAFVRPGALEPDIGA
jgi:DNA-binding transcriptional ArsR family regulator